MHDSSGKLDLTTASTARERLHSLANPSNAIHLQKYFKTGPGDYGHGDVFLGIKVPPLRKLATEFAGLPLPDIDQLLCSKFHEERLMALMILVMQYGEGDAKRKERIYRYYMRRKGYVNNWDLVDGSASFILGPHLLHRDHSVLGRLARSSRVWDRRIAVLATLHFIRAGRFETTLELAAGLLSDPHDLMHKAVGWMLREIGKRDVNVLKGFLELHSAKMPRTMLRYAIERLPKEQRLKFLKRAKA